MASQTEKWKQKVKSARRNAREERKRQQYTMVGAGLAGAFVGGYLDEGETEDDEIFGFPRREALGGIALGLALSGYAGKWSAEAAGASIGLLAKKADEYGHEAAAKKK